MNVQDLNLSTKSAKLIFISMKIPTTSRWLMLYIYSKLASECVQRRKYLV